MGAKSVVCSLDEAGSQGRYDLIFESVGGPVLGAALGWLASRGTCVLVGNAGGATTTFNADAFRTGDGGAFGGTRLYGFVLGEEVTRHPPAELLTELLEKVACGALDPGVRKQAPWTAVDSVARDLLERRFTGKAVLTLT